MRSRSPAAPSVAHLSDTQTTLMNGRNAGRGARAIVTDLALPHSSTTRGMVTKSQLDYVGQPPDDKGRRRSWYAGGGHDERARRRAGRAGPFQAGATCSTKGLPRPARRDLGA